MSRILLAFDVDGTINSENSEGPTPLECLHELKKRGAIVGLAGAAGKIKSIDTNLDFYYGSSDLGKLKNEFNADIWIHVADLEEDREQAKLNGFIFVHAEDFNLNTCMELNKKQYGLNSIIIGGGFATRLNPITKICPKPLLPLDNKPLIRYTLDKLRGMDTVYVTTNAPYMEQFKKATEIYDNIKLIEESSRKTDELKGSIQSMYDVFTEHRDSYIVIMGSIFTTDNLREFKNWDKNSILIGAYDIKVPQMARRYGVVDIDENNKVIRYIEKPKKPPSLIVAAGIYALPESVIDMVPDFMEEVSKRDDTFVRFGEFIQWLVDNGFDVHAKMLSGYYINIDFPGSYKRAWQYFISGKEW